MCVDGAERGGGQGEEHTGVVADRFGDAFASGQAGDDQVIGVVPVDLGTGRAAGRAAVPARGDQVAGRLVVGRVGLDQLAGLAVQGDAFAA